MKKKNYFLSAMAFVTAMMLSMGFTSCGDDDEDEPSTKPISSSISVTPTSISLLSNEGSTASVNIKTDGIWNISGCPDWLHMTSTSGEGNTSITITAKSENFSASVRSATLTVSTSSSSTSFTVNQDKYFPDGLEVQIGDMTIMSDGFACDLKFPDKAKGYREAFFTESQVKTMTERDMYNKLMKQDEYSGSLDWTWSPMADPNTTIIYCIAAYGNESNSDGSHKYGPMTIEKIATTAKTLWADMYLTSSYTSSRWTATAQKYGTYGTRCQKYYYFGTESEASTMRQYYELFTYAFLAHALYKPMIKEYPDDYAVSGQSFYFNRTGNQFFFGAWGIDDNNNYSAEHTATYINLSSSAPNMIMRQRSVADYSSWNEPRQHPSKAEMEKMRKAVKLIKM